MADIFLSYCRTDGEVMHRLLSDLTQNNLTVFTDEGIEPGTPSWASKIEEEIEIAQCMIVLLSPRAKQSIWIKRELHYALNRNLRVFPVLISGDASTSIPIELVSTQYVDLRNNYRKSAGDLTKFLENYIHPNDISSITPDIVTEIVTSISKLSNTDSYEGAKFGDVNLNAGQVSYRGSIDLTGSDGRQLVSKSRQEKLKSNGWGHQKIFHELKKNSLIKTWGIGRDKKVIANDIIRANSVLGITRNKIKCNYIYKAKKEG